MRRAMHTLLTKRGFTALSAVICLVAVGTAGCAFMGVGEPGSGATGGGGKVQWSTDWNEAITEAQAENKPMMITFYSDICPACRILDGNAFSDDELSVFLSTSFVCVRSNAGWSRLHTVYGIPGVPTTVFTSPDGAEITRIVGAASVESFYQKAQAALER